jgi:Mg2+ and Co2+ transporter CorA
MGTGEKPMSTALELAAPFVAIVCMACGAACLLYAWTRRKYRG